MFNDLAVAARAIQRDAGVGRVLILDLDVHHGDGTAAIFANEGSDCLNIAIFFLSHAVNW